MLLTEQEMLYKWALMRHNTDLRNDLTVTRPDGSPDIEIMREEMNVWYHTLLTEAPLEILHISQIANALSVIPTSATGIYIIDMPGEFLRFVDMEIETSAGRRRVNVVAPESRTAALQNNPRTMGGAYSPVAVRPLSGESAFHLYVNDSRAPRLLSFRAVTVPPKGTYVLTEAALGKIRDQS